MNRITQPIYMLILASLFWTCREGRVISPEPQVEIEEIVEIEWASRMNFDKEIVGSDNTLHYKEWVLVGGDLDAPPSVMAFNKETGTKDWTIVLEELQGNDITYMHLHQNILVARNFYHTFAIDLESKELIWQINFKEKNERLDKGLIASNNKYYQPSDLNFNPLGGHTQKLYEIDIFTGEYKQVYAQEPDAKGTKSISPPAIFTDQGSDIMIFNEHPNAEASPPISRQELVAIDIKTQNTIWRSNVTDKFASNGLHPPIIYDDRIVITGGDWHMYAFDIETGALLWKTSISDDSPFSIFIKTNHLIHDEMLYVNENGENVTCINPETGAIIWNNPMGGANCTDNMIYYEKEDLLVFASWGFGSIMILDALTGETIHREHRYDNSSYNNDIVYDEERNTFFTSTYKHAIGFTINRPK